MRYDERAFMTREEENIEVWDWAEAFEMDETDDDEGEEEEGAGEFEVEGEEESVVVVALVVVVVVLSEREVFKKGHFPASIRSKTIPLNCSCALKPFE